MTKKESRDSLVGRIAVLNQIVIDKENAIKAIKEGLSELLSLPTHDMYGIRKEVVYNVPRICFEIGKLIQIKNTRDISEERIGMLENEVRSLKEKLNKGVETENHG